MNRDFITGSLPETVWIDGKEYEINCDFRAGMQFEEIRKSDMEDSKKIINLLKLYYPRIPENIEAAIDKMIWFYRCGEEEKEEDGKQRYQRRVSKEPAFSFSQDAPYIYAAFKEQYDIDLSECHMHWWKFMVLFESLNEDTKMSKIMYYRKATVTGTSKERRAFLNDMKKLYRIKDSGKKLTKEERDMQWRKYVSERMKMLKQ